MFVYLIYWSKLNKYCNKLNNLIAIIEIEILNSTMKFFFSEHTFLLYFLDDCVGLFLSIEIRLGVKAIKNVEKFHE